MVPGLWSPWRMRIHPKFKLGLSSPSTISIVPVAANLATPRQDLT